MQLKSLLLGLGAAVCLYVASPAQAGGIGQVVITGLHGRVEIKPLHPGGRWQRAKIGGLQGMYLLRTGPRSWVHLGNTKACVDSNTLLFIGSGSDSEIKVRRGRVSAIDGKRGKRLTQLWLH